MSDIPGCDRCPNNPENYPPEMSDPKNDVLRVIRAGGLDGGPEIAAALIALEKELTVAQNHAKFMQNLANKLSAMLDVVEASRQEPEA